MLRRVHVWINLHNLSFSVNEKADPVRVLRVGTVAGAIGQAHRTVGIAKQWEIEVKLLRKGGVFLHAIEADAENLDAFIVVLLDSIAEPAALDSSPWGVGLGVEPQDHMFADEI